MLYNAAKLLLVLEMSKYFDRFCYLCRKFLDMKISKNRYLQGFVVVVLFLALVRLVFPSVSEPRLAENEKGQDSKEVDSLKGISAASSEESSTADDASSASGEASSSLVADDLKKDELSAAPDTAMAGMASIFFDKDGKEVKHRIFSRRKFQ